MEKPVLSVVIPVFNGEKYIGDRINGILEQDYKNYELILVDDGSTDSTLDILKIVQKQDNRVKVISKKNGGPSSARNCGIENSNGEFIMFLDADDYELNNMFSKMVEKIMIESADMVYCNYNVIIDGKIAEKKNLDIRWSSLPTGIDIKTAIVYEIHLGKHNEVWNKIYRNDIIKKFNIRFNEDIRMGEDLLFNINFIYRSNRISFTPQYFNNYNLDSDGSITKCYINDLLDMKQTIWDAIQDLCHSIKVDEKVIEKNLNFRIFYDFISCIHNLYNSDLSLLNQYKEFQYIVKNRDVIRVLKNCKIKDFEQYKIKIIIIISKIKCEKIPFILLKLYKVFIKNKILCKK